MRIEEIITDELAEQIGLEMRKDGHGVSFPTHVIYSEDDSIIGAYSLHFAPCLFFWMHTKRGSALSSYRALQKALGDILDLGHDTPLLLIQKESPFYPFMSKLGFVRMMKGEVMIQKGQ